MADVLQELITVIKKKPESLQYLCQCQLSDELQNILVNIYNDYLTKKANSHAFVNLNLNKLNLNTLIQLYYKTNHNFVREHIIYCLFDINTISEPVCEVMKDIISKIQSRTINVFEFISFPTTFQHPVYETFFNAVFDAWIHCKYPTFFSQGLFFSYESTLKKYAEINFHAFQQQSLYSINRYSKLALEDVCELLHLNKPPLYLFNLAEIPIKNPVHLFNSISGRNSRQSLCTNPCLTANDLLTMYKSTTSSQIKQLIYEHPNCPASLQLKSRR